MSLRIIRIFLIGLGIVFLIASKLFASTPDIYGMSSRASATAGLGTFAKPDPFFAYQNPSFLSQGERVAFSLGWMQATDSFRPIRDVVTQNNLSGKSVSIGDINTDYPNLSGVSLGIILPMRRKIPRIVLGATGFFPWGSLATIHTVENYLPVYANYFTRPKRFALIAGGAIEPIENLSLGFAANIYLKSGANTKINLNETNSTVSMTMDMIPAMAPIIGARYQWGRQWGMDIAYHARVDYAMSFQNKTELPLLKANGSDASIPIVQFLSKTSLFYDPQMIRLGISHLFNKWFQLGLQGTWKNWKRYRIPANQVTFTNPGEIGSKLPDIRFRNILSPSIGAECPFGAVLLRAGYRYEPQHIDFQEMSSNMIDTDVHVFSTGFGYILNSFAGFFSGPLQLDLHFQLHQLKPRLVSKADSNAVGYKKGGYMTGGSLLNYGITIGTTF